MKREKQSARMSPACKKDPEQVLKRRKLVWNLLIQPLVFTTVTHFTIQFTGTDYLQAFLFLFAVGIGLFLGQSLYFKTFTIKKLSHRIIYLLIKIGIMVSGIITIATFFLFDNDSILIYDSTNNWLIIDLNLLSFYIFVYTLVAFVSWAINENLFIKLGLRERKTGWFGKKKKEVKWISEKT